MESTDIDLHRIAADIFAAMLGLELKPNSPIESHPPEERVLTGCVQVTGDWSGAITVQCADRVARRAAALMFAMDDEELTDEEVSDTIGELANMTGGNVKSLLPGDCQLSLPSVTSGRDYQVTIPGAEPIDRAACDSDGELVLVTLLERSSGQ